MHANDILTIKQKYYGGIYNSKLSSMYNLKSIIALKSNDGIPNIRY